MKKYRLRLIIYAFIFMFSVGILFYSCYSYWGQIKDNRRMAIELEEKYKTLLDDEENLEVEVVKLQDPEYVAKYAREKYLYTKPGELIIDMSSLEE